MAKVNIYLGREKKNGELGDWVTLDVSKPRVGVIVGKRGSGKTYSASVLIEECLDRNPRAAYVIIDIMGVYWSLKYPNKNVKELNTPGFKGLIEPKGYADKTRVLVVAGDVKKYQKGTYDGTLTITPNMVSFDVWLSVFNLAPDEPQAMLLKSLLDKFEDKTYSIQELIYALTEELETGRYSKQTIVSLRSKFEYAKSWGIFSKTGMTLRDLAIPGVATIIDVSESSKPVSALLVGLLAEKIYDARKELARIKSWAKVSGRSVSIEDKNIPQTWLIIEEAHNFLPSRERTKASTPLITYVKEGRHPGCGLLLVSQEPAALDTKVLKQIDFLLVHNLSHKQDVEAVKFIAPSPLPRDLDSILIKLGKGEALLSVTGSEVAKKVKIRPKHSIHIARADIAEDKDVVELGEQPFSIWNEYERLKREVVELKAKLIEYQKRAGSKSSLIEKYMNEINKLKHELEKKDQVISELNQRLAEKDSIIRDLESQIKALQPKKYAVSRLKQRLLNSIAGALRDTIINELNSDAKSVLSILGEHPRISLDDLQKSIPSKIKLLKALEKLNAKRFIRIETINNKDYIILNLDNLIRRLSVEPLSDEDIEYVIERIFGLGII
ncbi:MAG: hypothetical protein DRO67_06455 [Candidatus Asgardarchaeum californiense]|nr:MAG: hypothetical protein DRO67_06455 [Candidatus Asgardarchaeum californiense]